MTDKEDLEEKIASAREAIVERVIESHAKLTGSISNFTQANPESTQEVLRRYLTEVFQHYASFAEAHGEYVGFGLALEARDVKVEDIFSPETRRMAFAGTTAYLTELFSRELQLLGED